MRFYFAVAIIALALTGVAYADDTPDHRQSFSRVDDASLAKAFGVPDPTDQQEITGAGGASVRSTALSTWSLYLLTCGADVRIKLGNSSVTAAATNTLRAATTDFYFLTGSHTNLAIYGASSFTCTLTRMKAGISVQ